MTLTPPVQTLTPPVQALTPPVQALTPPVQALTPPVQVISNGLLDFKWVAGQLDSIFQEDLTEFEIKLAKKCVDSRPLLVG